MFEIDKKKFGAFLSALRKEKGFTQKELAQRLFISDKAVSKWETGASIPDTSLLIPLSELLGVSVTELLMGERTQEPLPPEQVEDVVKTALSYPEKQKKKFRFCYPLCVFAGLFGLWVNYKTDTLSEPLISFVILPIIFGAYFFFFVQERLPAYYDKNRINCVSDGFFRMNVPGLSFNNSNWPHIVRVGQIWCCLSLILTPLCMVLFSRFAFFSAFGYLLPLLLFLGGLFIPMIVVGKKYE